MVTAIARETARRRRHRFQTREFASSLGAPAASRHRDPPLFIREFDHVSTRLVAAGTRRDVRFRDLFFGPLSLVVPVSSRFRRPNERTLNRGGGRTPRERRKFHRYKRRTQRSRNLLRQSMKLRRRNFGDTCRTKPKPSHAQNLAPGYRSGSHEPTLNDQTLPLGSRFRQIRVASIQAYLVESFQPVDGNFRRQAGAIEAEPRTKPKHRTLPSRGGAGAEHGRRPSFDGFQHLLVLGFNENLFGTG